MVKSENHLERMETTTHQAEDNINPTTIGAASKHTEVKPFSKSVRHPWTMARSYYFVMGGYAMDDSDSDQKFMPENNPRVTLTETI